MNKIFFYVALMACFVRCAVIEKKYKTSKDFVRKIENDIKEAVTVFVKTNSTKKTLNSSHNVFDGGPCLACLLLVEYQQNKIKNYSAAMKAMKTLTQGCITFHLEAPSVCSGGINVFGPEVAKVITHVKIPPKELCARIFPEKCAYYEDNIAVAEWDIKLPPKPNKENAVSKHSSTTGKVLQISDLHIDMKYLPMGDAECSEPMCCRKSIPGGKSRILKYIPGLWPWSKKYMEKIVPNSFDKEYANKRGAGVWGDYRNCDLPWWTFEHLLHTLSGVPFVYYNVNHSLNSVTQYEYIIWTGDGVAHNVWDSSKNEVIGLSRYISSSLQRHFPSTPVVPVIGNHDTFPSNNFPPSDLDNAGDIQWLYDELAEQWGNWLDDEAINQLKFGGFFVTRLPSGLRVVSLNTNYCYHLNWWVLLENEDPQGMLKWLVSVLTEAEASGVKVHILGHIPPGRSPDCIQTWSSNYYKIIERFRDTITGQFFGHTHFDEIELFYDNKKAPMSVGYLGPSVTPFSESNPAYRVYDVEFPSGKILDHSTYIFDLAATNKPDSNTNAVSFPKWTLEYSAKSAYNMTSLSPTAWHNIAQYWRKEYFGNGKLPLTLVKYIKLYSKSKWDGIFVNEGGYDSDKPCTDKKCIARVLCDISKNLKWEECK